MPPAIIQKSIPKPRSLYSVGSEHVRAVPPIPSTIQVKNRVPLQSEQRHTIPPPKPPRYEPQVGVLIDISDSVVVKSS